MKSNTKTCGRRRVTQYPWGAIGWKVALQKDLGVLMDTSLTMSQQCALGSMGILGCVRRSTASKVRQLNFPTHSVFCSLHFLYIHWWMYVAEGVTSAVSTSQEQIDRRCSQTNTDPRNLMGLHTWQLLWAVFLLLPQVPCNSALSRSFFTQISFLCTFLPWLSYGRCPTYFAILLPTFASFTVSSSRCSIWHPIHIFHILLFLIKQTFWAVDFLFTDLKSERQLEN